MKPFFYIFCLLLITEMSFSQSECSMPEFPGGDKRFWEFIGRHLKYPDELIAREEQGKVIAYIKIDKEGNTQVKALSFNPVLKEEVIRVLSLMPPWRPALVKGMPADTVITREFYFSLQRPRAKGGKDVFEVVHYRRQVTGDMIPFNRDLQSRMRRDKEGDAFYNSGVRNLEKDRVKEAVNDFTSALEKYPDDIDALYNRGIAYFRLKNIEKACEDWMAVRARNSTNANKALFQYCTLSEEEKASLDIDVMPDYIEGEMELLKFLQLTLVYPSSAKDRGIQGRVELKFIITKAGNVEKIEVVRGIGGGCNEEAVRSVAATSGKWYPGKKNGRAVDAVYFLPITFSLK
jgi:TonB family protein